MRYLVMENHLSYSVVIDQEGRFLKVANLNYQIGQTVQDVFPMEQPPEVIKASLWEKIRKWLFIPVLASLAIMVLLVNGYYQSFATFGTVFLKINPEVRIDVNRQDVVLRLEGVNADGTELIRGYEYKKKALPDVMDELVDRAIDMGYLADGGKVSIDLETSHAEWSANTGSAMREHLKNYLKDKVTVTIQLDGQIITDDKIIIPIPIPIPKPEPDSDYQDSDYGEDATDTDDDAPDSDSLYEPADDDDFYDDDSDYEIDDDSDYEIDD